MHTFYAVQLLQTDFILLKLFETEITIKYENIDFAFFKPSRLRRERFGGGLK